MQTEENSYNTTESKQIIQQNIDNLNIQDRPLTSNKSSLNGFDDKPVGAGSKIQFSEYPDENEGPPKVVKKVVKPLKAKKAVGKVIDTEEKVNQNNVSNRITVETSDKGKNEVIEVKSQFDEAPIGKKSNFNLSQFPDGEEPGQTTETNFTMIQKLKSKAVKLRLSGFEDLLILINQNQNSSELSQIQIQKLLKQSNPACLEKVLQCFKAWLEKGKNWGQDEARNAIENGYINGKPNTKKITIEITDIMYQLNQECIQTALLNGLKGKVPKTLAGYLAITNQLLAIYGIKRLKYLKPYLPEIVRVITNQKLAAVKTEGVNLLKEAYKWLGKEMVEPMLGNLKEAIKKQLQVFWQTYDKSVQMTAPKDIAETTVGNGGKSKKIDAYQLSDPIDIFKKFNEKWAQSVLKAQKWSQKVQLMQQFITAASIPKIANSDYRHINDMIKRLINDSNFNVVLMDLKILAVLSKGLRRPFANTVKSQFSNVLNKFRDKKTQMIDETFNTLNQFMYCVSIEDVLDDLKEGLSDKAPNMKVNLINWIGKFVQKKINQKGQLTEKASDALKSLFNIFQKLLSDGTAEVRECMAKNISKMKALIDEDFFIVIENKMNKNLANKVNDSKQNVKGKQKVLSKEKEIKAIQRDLSKSTLSIGVKETTKLLKTGKKDEFEENRKSTVQSGGKVDISNQVLKLLPKMNDNNNWQNRRQAAEALINLINQCNQRVNINCVGDLLATLKTRINDPNKQLIKNFVQLTGVVFSVISEKQIKNHGKLFISALAEGLSDKVDINRREISSTINKIGDMMGRQNLLNILGQFLEGDRQSRIQIINIILANEEYLSKADTRDYPKGIISCLCDKNKDIRYLGQRLLERIVDKTGIQIFRSLASQQRPAFTKDLNTLLDKFDKGNNLNNSFIGSKGVSPSRNDKKPNTMIPTHSNRKTINNKSLTKINKSFERQMQNENVGSTHQKTLLVEGDDFFAPVKILNSERIERLQTEERIPWRPEDIRQGQQQQLRQQMQRLINKNLVSKMFAFDYKRVMDSVIQIIKICKDINQQNNIRQVYDIFIKWAFLRLWGGNPSIQSIIQILPPIMSIIQKKKLVLNDNDVDLVIGVIREYFISASMNEQKKVSQSLYTIIKCLISLSSGEKVLKKVLKQFTMDLSLIHRHVRKEASAYYKEGFVNLIKTQMTEYVGNQDSLQEAAKIKELKNDQQFVDTLFKKFHENVLTSFGFKKQVQQSREKSVDRRSSKAQINHNSSTNSQAQAYNSNVNSNSRIQIKGVPQSQSNQLNHAQKQSDVKGEDRERDHSVSRKSNTSRILIKKPQADFDLNSYTSPNPCSPLGKNLAKLLPPNQATINFFAALLVENGEKISNQLITHAKIIFGSILKSVIQLLSHRNQYDPNKIISQITLLQQAIKCKNIIGNIGQLLYHATNFALNQLVYEDQNKILIFQDLRNRGIQFKIQNFIKAINGIMLRILQNGGTQQVTSILFTLLISHARSQYPSHKTICLIIKCIVRVANSFTQNCKPEHVRDYFLKINDYINAINFNMAFQQFQPSSSQKMKPEDSLINSIKNTLTEIIKLFKSEVWTHYEKAMSQSKYPDEHISSFINSMNIPYPSKTKSNQNNEQLKKMNELLSKTKTFQAGIERLKRYIEVNPDFSPIEYFSTLNYDQKFISMVIKSLQGSSNNIYRRPSNKSEIDDSNDGNIQDKIKKLKMKVEEMHIPRSDQVNEGPKKFQEEEKNDDRAQEIKRRIDQMKNKMISNNSFTRPR